MNDRLQPAHESFIDVAAPVGRQDHQPVVALDPLQQVGQFLVGIFIVPLTDFRALAEQGIGVVEKQDPVLVLGLVEQARQVLFGLPDVFRDKP